MLTAMMVAAAGTLGALQPDAEVIVGNVRVQAPSDTLIRIEPQGPMGFESNTTFMVVSRDWAGVPLTKGSTAGGVTTLTTSDAGGAKFNIGWVDG